MKECHRCIITFCSYERFFKFYVGKENMQDSLYRLLHLLTQNMFQNTPCLRQCYSVPSVLQLCTCMNGREGSMHFLFQRKSTQVSAVSSRPHRKVRKKKRRLTALTNLRLLREWRTNCAPGSWTNPTFLWRRSPVRKCWRSVVMRFLSASSGGSHHTGVYSACLAWDKPKVSYLHWIVTFFFSIIQLLWGYKCRVSLYLAPLEETSCCPAENQM